jgi:hypothetical protein
VNPVRRSANYVRAEVNEVRGETSVGGDGVPDFSGSPVSMFRYFGKLVRFFSRKPDKLSGFSRAAKPDILKTGHLVRFPSRRRHMFPPCG